MWDALLHFWPLFLGLLNILLAAVVTVHAVLRKRDSRAAIAWVGLAWLAPLVGAAAYFCFGINRIQRKAVLLRLDEAWQQRVPNQVQSTDPQRAQGLAARFPNLIGLERVNRHLTGQPLLPGNQVKQLLDGDEAFPAMLRAIDQAQTSVTLLSYIFDSDRAGDCFFDALRAAHERNVEVRVLIDDVGSRYGNPNMLARLQRAGIEAAAFLPTRVPRLFQYANLRNHRKILVIDGRTGFTGGTNLREGHWLSLEPKSPIQCIHFLVEGPVVAQMQEVFASDWAFARGESLHGPRWFPELHPSGPVWSRGISDGPDEDFEKIAYAMIGAITCASRSIEVVSPYFLPEAPVARALNVAALRGVDVRIYLPRKNNIALVDWACNAQLWVLLEKGCRVFRTSPPFDHTKLMIVDGIWSLIGSTNWDPRSLRLNFEFNLECYDENLASGLQELIRHKAATAEEVTLEQLHDRPFLTQLRDGLARLATPYL